MPKFFRFKWAETGDKTTIPDETDVAGFVSYQQGYGNDYARDPASDPLAKLIERDKMNQLFSDLTENVQYWQTHAFPEYITAAQNGGVAYAYDVGAIVRWTDNKNYRNTVAGNTNAPNVSGWVLYNNPADAINSAIAKTTLVDADQFGIADSGVSYALKKVTWANLKATILTAFGAMINTATAKTTPVNADIFIIGDSAASNASKKLTWANVKATILTAFGAMINTATAKTTPVDADIFIIGDSAASNASKKATWANVKATILSSFGVMINTATAKTTPVDADIFIIGDSAASNASKKLTWANIKTALTSVFAPANFVKPFQGAPLFSKTSASSITIPVGTKVLVGTTLVTVSTTVTLSLNTSGVGGLDTGTKTAGTDYFVYALSTGAWIISASKTAPSGYTTSNSRKVGGFHYGVIPEAFTAINNITSDDATKIAGINAYSFWDLKFRPVCDPSGMVHVFGRWYDIYLLNVDHHLYGTSAAGKTIAGGEVIGGRNYPKIPLFYGGDGTVTYGSFTWFEAAEIGKAYSKDLISYDEFAAIAYGVLEAASAGDADTGITQHLANFTSKFGLSMATGCQWIWGKDLGRSTGSTYTWKANTEGRGSIYSDEHGPAAAIFGGSSVYTTSSGSRSSMWHNYVWNTAWVFGCRYACDHLEVM